LKDIKDIDQLISSKMEGFDALPPAESWLAIQDSLQQVASAPSPESAAQPNLLSKIGNFANTASLTTKITALSILGVVAVSSILLISSDPKPELINAKQNLESTKNEIAVVDKAIEEEKVIAENKKQEGSNPKRFNVKETQSASKNLENNGLLNQVNSENLHVSESLEKEVNHHANHNNHSVSQAIEMPKPMEATRQQESKKPEGKKLEKEIAHSKPTIYDVITPNGDGSNDVWIVSFDEPLTSYYLRIYNNKGEVVFETHSSQEHWHGLHLNSGELCEEGRYIFELQYKYLNSQEAYQERGFINLIR